MSRFSPPFVLVGERRLPCDPCFLPLPRSSCSTAASCWRRRNSDGGGKVIAALRVLAGLAEVAAFLMHIARKPNGGGWRFAPTRVNGNAGVLISTESRVEPLSSLDGVAEIKSLGNTDWEIRLRENADSQSSAQAILEKCFSSGIVLRRFDQSEPSLHDAFVALVGAENLKGEAA